MGKESRTTTVRRSGVFRPSLKQNVWSMLFSLCILAVIPIKSTMLRAASFSGNDAGAFHVPHVTGGRALPLSLSKDEYLTQHNFFPPAHDEERDAVSSQRRDVRRGVDVQLHKHNGASAINPHGDEADVPLEQLMNDLGVGEGDVEHMAPSWHETSHRRSAVDLTMMNAFGFSELDATKSSASLNESVQSPTTKLHPSNLKSREQRVMDLLEQLETLTRQTPVEGEDDQFVDFSFEPESVTANDFSTSSSTESDNDASQLFGGLHSKPTASLFHGTEAGISMTDVTGHNASPAPAEEEQTAGQGDGGKFSRTQLMEPSGATEANESDSPHDVSEVAETPAEAGTDDPTGNNPPSPESDSGNTATQEAFTSTDASEKGADSESNSPDPTAGQSAGDTTPGTGEKGTDSQTVHDGQVHNLTTDSQDILPENHQGVNGAFTEPTAEDTTEAETNTQMPKHEKDGVVRQRDRMDAHSSAESISSKAPADFSDMMFARLREASRGMASVLHIVEHGRLLDDDSLVTIAYHFPFETRESRRIAFIIVALPPGYTARTEGPLCESVDPDMPPLSCEVRLAHLPQISLHEATEDQNVFIQVSSADKNRSLPLGMHHFAVAVHTPRLPIAVNTPANWWFVTFRFTGGHAVTKHFENRVLIAREKCAWGGWRQETPCSATCGEGVEVWSRTLFGGESEEACGGALLKKKCFRASCSVSCQLGPWETIVDCTKSCDADNRRGYQVSIRKVLMDKEGWGVDCKRLYPWNPEAHEGWSEKLGAVVRLSVCDTKFRQACEPELGCRVEKVNTRTLSVSYPWGSCPFPCGGLGKITSIVQVANGIPRWLGEKDFPESFQVPCRADKEPLVKRVPCNTFDCEDCSVYLERVKDTTAFRAWIFFLPSQDANTIKITAPRGINFDLKASSSAADAKSGGNQAPHSRVDGTETKTDLADNQGDVAGQSLHWKATHLLPQARKPTEEEIQASATEGQKTEKGQVAGSQQKSMSKNDAETHGRNQEDIRKLYEGNACSRLPTSFGYISSCGVSPSTKYEGAQEATMHLSGFIAPQVDTAFDRHIYPHLQSENAKHRLKEGSAEENRRPEWMAVPVTLEQAAEMENPGNFYMWLSSTSTPRDPEVFKCHLKTKLAVPVKCRYDYTVVDPKDCADCHLDSPKKIMTLRQFVPAKHGGSCSIPLEQRFKNPVAVYAKCSKGCSHVQHDVNSFPGSTEETSGTKEGTRATKTEAIPLSSRLKSVSRGSLKRILDRAANRQLTEGGTHDATHDPSLVHRIDINKIPDFEDVMKMAAARSDEEIGERHVGLEAKGGSPEHTEEAVGGPSAAGSPTTAIPVRPGEARSGNSETGDVVKDPDGSSRTGSSHEAPVVEEGTEKGETIS